MNPFINLHMNKKHTPNILHAPQPINLLIIFIFFLILFSWDGTTVDAMKYIIHSSDHYTIFRVVTHYLQKKISTKQQESKNKKFSEHFQKKNNNTRTFRNITCIERADVCKKLHAYEEYCSQKSFYILFIFAYF